MANETSGDNKKSDDEVMQLRYLQSLYTQQYEVLENEIATYSFTIAAVERNINILEDSGRIEGSNVLLSGEGGTYIEASVKSMQKVITYVGAGYLVEKDVAEAKAFLDANKKRQEEDFRKLIAEKQRLESELIDLSYALSSTQ